MNVPTQSHQQHCRANTASLKNHEIVSEVVAIAHVAVGDYADLLHSSSGKTRQSALDKLASLSAQTAGQQDGNQDFQELCRLCNRSCEELLKECRWSSLVSDTNFSPSGVSVASTTGPAFCGTELRIACETAAGWHTNNDDDGLNQYQDTVQRSLSPPTELYNESPRRQAAAEKPCCVFSGPT